MISPYTNPQNMSPEPEEQTAARIMQFCANLNFRFSNEEHESTFDIYSSRPQQE
jgi:hypothetical protein